jgi:hypothetical protein
MAGANVPAAMVAMAQGRPINPNWLAVQDAVKAEKTISLQILQ